MQPLANLEYNPSKDQAFSSHFIASEEAVRDVLGDLRLWLVQTDVTSEAHGTTELVLAEALNNIVEHAYDSQTRGLVRVDIWRHDHHLSFTLSDHGRALPDLQLPGGGLPTSDCALEDLPEGGFGWFLIHRLTQNLQYERLTSQNRLCFDIVTNEALHN